MHRGDTALWILTKMAMVFFIVSLAAILLLFGNRAQAGLCDSEAHTLSQSIASAISQTLNTPLEDQRQLVALPPSLSIGNGINSRYLVTLSRLAVADATKPNLLIVSTTSVYNPSCSASVQVSYERSWDPAGAPSRISFVPETGSPTMVSRSTPYTPPQPGRDAITQTMTLQPSSSCSSPDSTNGDCTRYGVRSRFLSLVTCTQKTTARNRFVFLEDCTKDNTDTNRCLSIDSPGSTHDLCGFNGA